MCGLFATFNVKEFNSNTSKIALNHLAKRGPDSEGKWSDDEVFLGFRRLSIIDLKPRSNQPMESSCGDFLIIFNGEIYNFHEIKKSLLKKNINFLNNSDTEVLLNLFILEGEKMLKKLRGMFSFIIYNKKTQVAFIARDPYGIKPLYYGKTNTGLIFASQVKTILLTRLVKDSKDTFASALFSIFGNIPEPYTLFKNIKSVKAGHFLWIKKGKIILYKKWYDIGKIFKTAKKNTFLKKEKMNSILKRSINKSIKYHLVSDVKIAVFLSAGVDSTILAALIKENGIKNLIGITIYFDEFLNTPMDEIEDAKKIANYYGIKHYTRKVTKKEFSSDLPKIFEAMDQPSIDGINTWYASKAAAELKLKVAISGIGADELFFGYNHFSQIIKLKYALKIINSMPLSIFLLKALEKFLYFITKNHKFKYLSSCKSIVDLWILKRSFALDEKIYVKNKPFNLENIKNFYFNKNFKSLSINNYLALAEIESKAYLRNQLLRDSDWASMYHGIELRTPFVDYHLLKDLRKIIISFPDSTKKNLLNSIIIKKLPTFVLKRKKSGFNFPIKKWVHQILQKKNISFSKFILSSCYANFISCNK